MSVSLIQHVECKRLYYMANIFYFTFLVFDDTDNHCYCHHEILINTYPLALEWLDYDPGQPEVKGKHSVHGKNNVWVYIECDFIFDRCCHLP